MRSFGEGEQSEGCAWGRGACVGVVSLEMFVPIAREGGMPPGGGGGSSLRRNAATILSARRSSFPRPSGVCIMTLNCSR
eukprot:723811-Rhodomonas_salina.1